jgi:hypothetical protein
MNSKIKNQLESMQLEDRFKEGYYSKLDAGFKQMFERIKTFFKGYHKKQVPIIDEDKNYTPLCAKVMFLGKAKFTGDDPNLSSLDKKVMPHLLAGSLIGVVDCSPRCLGYDPIPVREFPYMTPNKINDYCAKCKRSYPPPIKNYSVEEWEKLRQDTLDFIKKYKEQS